MSLNAQISYLEFGIVQKLQKGGSSTRSVAEEQIVDVRDPDGDSAPWIAERPHLREALAAQEHAGVVVDHLPQPPKSEPDSSEINVEACETVGDLQKAIVVKS